MCKGDGGQVLSNVELILPWNVVEACYTLERNDSTCFFAANDAEGTTSQISLCKLEDNSVKIQVTVTALESNKEADAEARTSRVAGDGYMYTECKNFTLFGSDGESPVHHKKKLRSDLDLEAEGQEEDRIAQETKPETRQGEACQMNHSVAARKTQAGFNLTCSMIEKKGAIGSSKTGNQGGSGEPAMLDPETHVDGEVELDLHNYQMKELEKQGNCGKVQKEATYSKKRCSMAIVLESEHGSDEEENQTEEKNNMEDTQGGSPVLHVHVIEPLIAESHDGPEHWEYPDRDQEQVNNEDQSTQAIYTHQHSKQRAEINKTDLVSVHNYECSQCDQVFSEHHDLTYHINCMHKSTKVFACDKCPKVFQTKKTLKRHRYIHRERPHICKFCTEDFHLKGDMNKHINCMHKTTQGFMCDKCSMVFSTKGRLARHRYIHGESRHICKFCGKGFHSKDNMNSHISRVHEKNNGKMWKCSYCSKEFLVKGNMTQHIRGIHLKQFPFTCSKCQKGFRRMHDMVRHMEKCNVGRNLSAEMLNDPNSETREGWKRQSSSGKNRGSRGQRRSRSKGNVTQNSVKVENEEREHDDHVIEIIDSDDDKDSKNGEEGLGKTEGIVSVHPTH